MVFLEIIICLLSLTILFKPSKHNGASNVGNDNFVTSFMTLLDNEDVVAKLAQVLSVAFQLLLEEKLNPIIQRLDTVIKDKKP